jgi:hypothetical protein
MLGIGIRLGINRHGLDAHGPGRSDDAAGDLAAVGDQDLFEHQALCNALEAHPSRRAFAAAPLA